MALNITIASRAVGPENPCLLVAEVAQAHDGSLGTAHAFIDAVADTGADAVKFQTHIASAESTRDEQFRVAFSKQDATRYDYWRRMEFTPEQWAGLAEHARERGLIFLSSAFSEEAVALLAGLGMPAWKIGSGEVFTPGLLEAMAEASAATRAPVLLSTGMSSYADVAAQVERIRSLGLEAALMQCTSAYPSPLAEAGLNVIDELRARFGLPTGLSDHSGTVFPGLAAMARGADLLEVHVVLDKRMFGPDTPASVDMEQLALLAQARDAFHTMLSRPVDKDAAASKAAPLKQLFSKSLAPLRALAKGTVLAEDMLTLKKPGTGIPHADLDKVLGRALARDVAPDRLLTWEDLDGQA